MITRGKATDEELAYIAGFMDADGYIGMCKNSRRPVRYFNPRYQAEIVVTNNHRPVLEWMQSLFGGSIQTRKQVLPHHKPTYAWKCGDLAGLALLQEIRPSLRVKCAQADVLIAFQTEKRRSSVGRGVRLTEEEVARYERYYQQYRALNDDRRPQRLSEKAPLPAVAPPSG